jgi:hypothetical protein
MLHIPEYEKRNQLGLGDRNIDNYNIDKEINDSWEQDDTT